MFYYPIGFDLEESYEKYILVYVCMRACVCAVLLIIIKIIESACMLANSIYGLG